MDIIPPITEDLSTSLPIKYILCACIAGAANKIYDDVNDNFRFDHLKTPHNAEILKGIHYIMCTILGIAYPLFFVFLYIIVFINKISAPSSYEFPYENSLLYSFSFLFLFLDYSKMVTLYADEYYFITISILFVAIEEVYDYISKRLNKNEDNVTLLREEVSNKKLWVRIAFIASLIVWNLKCKLSPSIKPFIFYFIAYFAVSCCVQFYSLYIYKPQTPNEESATIEEQINAPKKYL